MGQTISARILFAALFAALVIISLFCKPWLVHWLSTRTIDQLYAILDWSLWAVIIGVIVEEWELVPKVWKFSRLVWIGDTKQACSKLRKHTGKLVESVGFLVLVIGLAGELAIDPRIEAQQTIELNSATDNAKKANIQTTELGKFTAGLEDAIAPRLFNEEPVARAISKFSDIPVLFDTEQKDEPKDFSNLLSSTFILAGWSSQNMGTFTDSLPLDGVQISFEGTELLGMSAADERTKLAATAFCLALRHENIFAKVQSIMPDDWPMNLAAKSLLVFVSVKPSSFFLDEELKKRGLPPLGPEHDNSDLDGHLACNGE